MIICLDHVLGAGNISVVNTQPWAPDCHPTNLACISASKWNITLGPTGQTKCEVCTMLFLVDIVYLVHDLFGDQVRGKDIH